MKQIIITHYHPGTGWDELNIYHSHLIWRWQVWHVLVDNLYLVKPSVRRRRTLVVCWQGPRWEKAEWLDSSHFEMYLNSELNQLKLGAAGDLSPGSEICFNQHQPGSTQHRHQHWLQSRNGWQGKLGVILLDVVVLYKQTIPVFPVLGMIQTGQSSVQGTTQSCPAWYSDKFRPDGFIYNKLQLHYLLHLLCCALPTWTGPKPGCLVGVF